MIIEDSKTFVADQDEIIKPFCQICHNLMEEMCIHGHLHYICSICGASNKPMFINTNPGILKEGVSHVF